MDEQVTVSLAYIRGLQTLLAEEKAKVSDLRDEVWDVRTEMGALIDQHNLAIRKMDEQLQYEVTIEREYRNKVVSKMQDHMDHDLLAEKVSVWGRYLDRVKCYRDLTGCPLSSSVRWVQENFDDKGRGDLIKAW